MKYLDLENNVKVSHIGIGCMRISGMSACEADALVHTALDAGINFFDHADIYGGDGCGKAGVSRRLRQDKSTHNRSTEGTCR